MKAIVLYTTVLTFTAISAVAQQKILNSKNKDVERAKFEHIQTRDLNTNTIPRERMYQTLENITKQNAENVTQRSNGVQAILQPRWLEVGPTNVGGRVRAFVLRSNNTAWAGGINGGLWKAKSINNTIMVDWQKKNDRFDKLNITAFAIHPSNGNIAYFSTGEGFRYIENFDNVNEQALNTMNYGVGIWKTTNGGVTWVKLPCGKFRFINRMVVAYNGDLFVASGHYDNNTSWATNFDSTGIMRLPNNTFTFQKHAPSASLLVNNSIGSDIALAPDSTLYCSVGLQDGVANVSNNTSYIFKTKLIAGVWQITQLFNTLPTVPNTRIKFACAKTNPVGQKVVYTMYEKKADRTLLGIYKSIDGGVNWTSCSVPVSNVGSQLYYNMALVVHPNDASKILLGAENVFISTNSGSSWTQISTNSKTTTTLTNKTYMHPDQHDIIWKSTDTAYAVNDGGVWLSTNVSTTAPQWTSLNNNLNITQFNTCAMSPSANSFNYIAGAQDNGSQYIANKTTHATSVEASGGDGSYTFYSPQTTGAMLDIVVTSAQLNQYYRYNTTTGVSTDVGPVTQPQVSTGLFVNPTEVIWSTTNALIIASSDPNTINFYPNVGTTSVTVAPTNKAIAISSTGFPNGQISFIKQSPTQANTVYLGTTFGRVYKYVYNPTTFATVSLIYLNTTALPVGFVSYIDVRGTNDAELIVTFSNYGAKSVWYTSNATAGASTTWKALDISTQSTAVGRLPDVPVWTALFAPTTNNPLGIKILIGTEIGVYSTTAIADSNTTVWTRDNNSPNTRITQIKYRPTDQMLLMSTYGRGLWRSDMFCTNQIWFGSSATQYNDACPNTFVDSSAGFIATRWDIYDDGTIDGTTTNFTTVCGLHEWDWVRMDKQLTAGGAWISIKRRVGDMFKINTQNVCAACSGSGGNLNTPVTTTDFIAYPNPSNGSQLTIQLQNELYRTNETTVDGLITIYNLQGQIVHTTPIFAHTENIIFNQQLQNGMYLIKLRIGESETTKKLTILN